MKSRMLAAAMLLIGPPACAGTFLTGQALLDKMRVWEKFTQDEKAEYATTAGIYMGYVQGVFDANSGGLCGTPQNLSVGTMSQLVAKYLNDHPVDLQKPASDSVLKALRQAYPCGAAKPGAKAPASH